MQEERQGTSPWVWILGGCGGCLVLAVVAVVGVGLAGYKWTRGFVEDLESPDAREAKAREILGAEELPAGYHAAMPLSIPWLTDLVVLTDQTVRFERKSPDSLDIDLDDESFGDRVFMYIGARSFSSSEKDVEDFFAGRQVESMQALNRDSRVRDTELLREGVLEVRDTPVRYRIDRGTVDAGADGEDRPGLVIRLHFRCPDSDWLHLGLWTGPAAEVDGAGPEASVETVTAPGLPTDEGSIAAFLGHFDVCA